MSEIKFIREGRFVDPWGRDLGPVVPEKAPESDSRTVAQLKDALGAAGVEVPSGANKDALLALAREKGV